MTPNWQHPSTAPKDGTPIIASFKCYPAPLMAIYSGASQAWCAAIPQVDMYEGQFNDWYFENEYFSEDSLTAWTEAPTDTADLT